MIGTQNSRRARVLLADDHMLIAEACKTLLEPEFEVIGTVADGRALLRASAELKPDVIICDIAMPLLNGLDAADQAKQATPDVRLVFVTMNTDLEVAAEAFRRNASGYLLKTSAASELVVAVRAALKGESYLSPQLSRGSIPGLLRKHGSEPPQLTERQREVLQLLAEGRSMKEVAAVLNLATRTVAFHKYRIMEILGLKNNADLVQYAIRNSIIPA